MDLKVALVANLEYALSNAALIREAAYAAQSAESIMLLRTRQGSFLNSGHRTKYSEGHKRKRQAEGLATDKVYLYFRGNLLQDIKTKATNSAGQATVEVGYIDGQSDPASVQLATYFNVSGAGRNKVLYKFVGLTAAEIDTIETAISERITRNIEGK